MKTLPRHEISEKAASLLLIIVHCLLTLGKVFNRRAFTPEAFAELQPLRYSFISQGGILILWLLIRKVGDAKLKAFVYKSFFDYVLLDDLEQQLMLLKGLTSEAKTETLVIKEKIHTEPGIGDDTLLRKYATLSNTYANIRDQTRESSGSPLLRTKQDELKDCNIFQSLAKTFTEDDALKSLEEYIEMRKEGIFGFEDGEREKKKILSLIARNLKKDENKNLQVHEK